MEFFETILKRHCVRNFNSEKEIKEGELKRIIQAGKAAPSAGGIYSVGFNIIKELNKKMELVEAAMGQSFIGEAPVVLVIWADTKRIKAKYADRGEELYVIQDAAAAAENAFLAVTALGLNACWVGAFDEEKVQKIADLSKHQRPMVLIPIGYEK